eukprot:5922055-Pleurochrysis_carterae.AAC.2
MVKLTYLRCLNKLVPVKGGSENVNFTMHALHATLVHRGIFDEILWARLPPDHSHEEIDRLFSTVEDILSSPCCPEFGCVSDLIAYLHEQLTKTEYARMSVSKVQEHAV